MNIKTKIIPASYYFLFWSWNLIFVFLIAFLLAENVIIPIITNLVKGATPIEQGLFAISLFVTPFIAIGLGVTKGFRQNPRRLLKLFFGFELPLFFLALARLFITSELHAATIYLALVALLGIAAYSLQLFTYKYEKTPGTHLFELGTLHFTLIFGVYIGILLLFISIPLLSIGITGFFSFEWLDVFKEAPLAILFAFFIIYTLTLFIGLPVMLCILYTHAFWKKYRQTAPLFKYKKVLALMISILAMNAGVMYFTNIQNQAKAVAILIKPIENDQDKKELLEQQALIRSGLLNAYLKNVRYSGSTSSNSLIRELYTEAFGYNRYISDSNIQNAFNFFAAPFLFNNTDNSYNPEQIAQYYADFFDEPIEKAERKTIRSALKSDWQRNGFEAGLIDANQEKVWIESQSITIDESKHSALITLQETYYNQTFEQQEILYHFSLPADAALTGVWLSDDKQDMKKYAYTVSPRGAAQKLYKQEVQRRIDPALLEQVGPYQYRLRIFPIPRKQSESKYTFKTNTKPMYMRLQYVIPLTHSRMWVLPKLLEKRNVFWTKETMLTVNNLLTSRTENSWLPIDQISKMATPLGSKSVTLITPTGKSYTVDIKKQRDLIMSHIEHRYAVLIDTSSSMRKHQNNLYSLLRRLSKHTKTSSTNIDYFLVGETVKPIVDINSRDILFFGHSGHLSHLQTWQKYKPETHYDALIIVTDEGAYELNEEVKLRTGSHTPIWLLHVSNKLPYAYDDKLFDLIMKSKGGIATTFETILQQTKQTNPNIHTSGHFQWLFREGSNIEPRQSDPQLVQLAARQYITHHYRKHKSSGLDTLDQLHNIAIQNSIVTPFSSMIVLVNDEQKQRLKNLSEQENRFDRDVEQARVISGNDLFETSGVPEPEEWALIIIICLILSGAYIRKRSLLNSNNHRLF